jgi:hypothetical protein
VLEGVILGDQRHGVVGAARLAEVDDLDLELVSQGGRELALWHLLGLQQDAAEALVGLLLDLQGILDLDLGGQSALDQDAAESFWARRLIE